MKILQKLCGIALALATVALCLWGRPAFAETTLHVGIYDFNPLCGKAESGAGGPYSRGLFEGILHAISDSEQWNLEFVHGTLQDSVAGLAAGTLDLAVAVPLTHQPQDEIVFSGKTVISTWAQLYSIDAYHVQSVLDLNLLSVGVVRDSPYNQELRSIIKNFKVATAIVEFKRPEDVLDAMQRGWVDAGAFDRIWAAQNAVASSLRVTPVIFAPVQLRFAASRESARHLLPVIDYFLEIFEKDPQSELNQHVRTIFESDKNSRLVEVLFNILHGAAALLVLFGGGLLLLRQRVRSKTRELSMKNTVLEQEIQKRNSIEQELKQQAEYLTGLHDISIRVIGRLKLDDLLAAIVSRAASLMSTDHGFLFLYESETDSIVARVGLGLFSGRVGHHLNCGQGIAGKVWESGDLLVVNDYASWQYHIEFEQFNTLHSVVAIPLRSHDRFAGVIGIGSTCSMRSFTATEIDILKRFADLASIAIDNAHLYENLRAELQERKRAENARTLLATAIDQSMESIFITDAHGVICYVNAAGLEETGCSRDEIIGGKAADILYGALVETDTNVLNGLAVAVETGTNWRGRLSCRRKDGSAYEAEEHMYTVRNETGDIVNFISLRRDVTRETALERQLRQSQKMEAIGTLAGGIAHDFNNILVPIIGFTEMTIIRLSSNEKAVEHLRNVLRAACRARDLVGQILMISRQREGQLQKVFVQPVLKEALKLLRASLPSTITIVQNIESSTGAVVADPTQIHQIVMNLCTNAFHAMRARGGTLQVSLQQVCVDPSQSAANTSEPEPGSYVQIAVSDTGIGMEQKVLERIFDPYFTTKPLGEGTGMGLAVVHGIVSSYGGRITINSRPGIGTDFYIYLPLADAAASETPAVAAIEALKGTEHILIVDDEDQVAEALKQILASLGYAVSSFTSSIEALQYFKANSALFDLVITDLTMPVMTGIDFARQVRAFRPGVPVIMCTGFTDDISPGDVTAAGIKRLLRKPILRKDIGAAVRDVLDGYLNVTAA
jgi:PAS domain S-box-containing protein